MTSDPTNVIQNPERLAALGRTGLLDSPPEAAFDRLTRLASRLLRAPASLVSLVDANRQFFKSHVGMSPRFTGTPETALTHSFCKHVVEAGEPFVVEDAHEHPIAREISPLEDMDVRAYAGVPLTTSDGQTLGSFCVLDSAPRAWTAEDIQTLHDLAEAVITEIELRIAGRELRRQMRATERERRRNQLLLECVNEGIFGLDHDGRCTFINQAATGLLRLEPDEALGKNMHTLVHHSRPDGSPYPEAECPVYQALRRGEGVRVEDEVLWRRDGTSFPVEMTSAPIIEAGEVQGMVVSFANISRRKRLEELRDDLLHMIVHDLRTPLTSLMAGMQSVGILGELNDRQRSLLEIARRGGETLLGMINDLLDIDKMEQGSLTLERTEVSVPVVAETALAQVGGLAAAKTQTIAADIAPDLPAAYADEDKLRRILVNLLGNAIKFTPAGGTITLSVRRDGDTLIFSVRDTGEGIPKEDFERIFQKFGQVETRKSGRRMSTGLGLTFCRLAVEAHGGRIWVESELGVGSVFSFTLPLVP